MPLPQWPVWVRPGIRWKSWSTQARASLYERWRDDTSDQLQLKRDRWLRQASPLQWTSWMQQQQVNVPKFWSPAAATGQPADEGGNHIEMGLHVFFFNYANLFALMRKAGSVREPSAQSSRTCS